MSRADLIDKEKLDRIEKKLDMVIEFFNIHPDRVPDRSRKELREMARAKIFSLQKEQKPAKQPCYGNQKDRE